MLSVLPIFIHVPRTAGTSIRVMISTRLTPGEQLSVYGNNISKAREFIVSYLGTRGPGKLDKLRLVEGHISFGCHVVIPRPCTYFTILREPISRVISLYKYILRDRGHPMRREVVGMSLEEFVSSGISLEVNNGQCRQLCGTEGELPQKPWGNTVTPFGKCKESMLDEAVENLVSYFSFVGVTEKFSAVVTELENLYGWRDLKEVHANANSSQVVITPKALKVMERLNKLDARLYEFTLSGGSGWGE